MGRPRVVKSSTKVTTRKRSVTAKAKVKTTKKVKVGTPTSIGRDSKVKVGTPTSVVHDSKVKVRPSTVVVRDAKVKAGKTHLVTVLINGKPVRTTLEPGTEFSSGVNPKNAWSVLTKKDCELIREADELIKEARLKSEAEAHTLLLP